MKELDKKELKKVDGGVIAPIVAALLSHIASRAGKGKNHSPEGFEGTTGISYYFYMNGPGG